MAFNPKSLANLSLITKENAIERARKGKEANVSSKKTKKTFKEIAQQLLNMEASKDISRRITKDFPELCQGKVTQRTVMLAAQLRKARAGNTKAFEVIRDTAGEKPIEQVETSHVFNKMDTVSLDGQALTFDVGEDVTIIDTNDNIIEEEGTGTPAEGTVVVGEDGSN